MNKPIMRASLIVSCVLLPLPSPAAPTPTFSADLVTATAAGRPMGRPGRVYVSNGRVRIEAPQFADGFFIVDGDNHGAWFVRPRPRLFMEAKQSSLLTQLLVPVDPDEPCRQWQIMATVAGAQDADGEWQCELAGRDRMDERETLKYLAIAPDGGRSYRWIDPQRRFPVRIETADGKAIALENIADAPQAPRLFAIPPEYHKFDPAQLIEQVKQSDVWVESQR